MNTRNNGRQETIHLISTTLVFFSLIVASSFILAMKIAAQSPTPEISPTAEEVSDDKVQGIREAVKEKVREKLEEVQKGQKRAFVGEIKKASDNSLTLMALQGEKQVTVSEETTIIDKDRKEIELDALEVGDYLIAMGYLEETDVLSAVRIVVTNELKVPDREVAFGEVTDISAEEKILTVKNQKKGTIYTVETTATTKITKKIEGKVQEVKFADINEGDRLVAIGKATENEETIISAKIIHIIPGQAIGLTEEEAPSPTPSPKATPTVAVEEEE